MRMQLRVDFFTIIISIGSFNCPGQRGWERESWMCCWKDHGMGTRLPKPAKVSVEISQNCIIMKVITISSGFSQNLIKIFKHFIISFNIKAWITGTIQLSAPSFYPAL